MKHNLRSEDFLRNRVLLVRSEADPARRSIPLGRGSGTVTHAAVTTVGTVAVQNVPTMRRYYRMYWKEKITAISQSGYKLLRDTPATLMTED